jgi:GntR family transcriptional regulator
VPNSDLGAGKLMVIELQQSLGIPIQLVPIEELSNFLSHIQAATVVTSRYFMAEVEHQTQSHQIRVIPIDIQDYEKELSFIKTLPKNSYLGIVSLSAGILRVAEMMVYSIRGDEIMVTTCQVQDEYRIQALIRTAHTIISDRASIPRIKSAIKSASEDLIRIPKIVESENYIGSTSIGLLKRELGLI